MYFQLLGRSPTAPAYRGVHRYGPPHADDLPDSAPYNLAWKELVDAGERQPSEQRARALLASLDPADEKLDIIGVELVSNEDAVFTGLIIGYDVATNGWTSLLSNEIRWDDNQKRTMPLGPILQLIEDHYSTRLNEFGLFPNFIIANSFKSVLLAVQQLRNEGVWDAPGHFHPDVLAIYGLHLTR